jgi:hypothetical protein
MTERKMLRVFCSRDKGAHEVGAVYATTEGPRLRVSISVESREGTFGHEVTYAAGDEHGMGSAWCAKCRKHLPVVPDAVLAAAAKGDRMVKLHAEGMWRDPLGVLDRKRGTDMR